MLPIRTIGMRLRATLCVTGALFLLLNVRADRIYAQSPEVAVDLDHAAFAYTDSTTLVELYFAFGAQTLPFEPDSAGYRASIPVQVRLAPAETPAGPLWSDSLILQFSVADTAEIQSGQMFLHQLRSAVPPGRYLLTVDRPENSSDAPTMRSFERPVTVPNFDAMEEPQFSDLSLASRINRSRNQDSPFYKNGLLVRPNPRLVYGPGLDRLFYYVELYRPGSAGGVDDQYEFRSYVTPVDEQDFLDGLERIVDRPVRSPDVLVGSFDVSTLPSGSYELHAELRTGNDDVAAEQKRKFYVYNPDQPRGFVPPSDRREISSRYEQMDEQMVEVAVRAVGAIASDAEREIIAGLDNIQEKREFLTRFWARRDGTPRSTANLEEARFYENLQVVREQFGTPFSEPWETDRGRVMLQYGAPDRIAPYLHQRETRPYVIWQYDHIPGDGEAVFIFIDREGFGAFRLAHSTATGEVKNPDWRRLIR
jgi:GWxTD domain-containing protein